MATLSERINEVMLELDQQHSLIRKLVREVEAIDGIEAVPYFADLPEWLATADRMAASTVNALDQAAKCAKAGGA
jgi:hypothetical protein